MLVPWQHRLLIALGVFALALVAANAVMFSQNRDAQLGINQRQQFIQQTVPLEGLYRDIVKALAELGVKNNDQKVLQMLAAQGINVSVNAPAAPAAAPAVAAPAAAPKR